MRKLRHGAAGRGQGLIWPRTPEPATRHTSPSLPLMPQAQIPHVMSLQALPARLALLCWKKPESTCHCHQQEAVSFPRPGSRRKSTEWRDRARLSCSPAEQRASTQATSAPTSLRLARPPSGPQPLPLPWGRDSWGCCPGRPPICHLPAGVRPAQVRRTAPWLRVPLGGVT